MYMCARTCVRACMCVCMCAHAYTCVCAHEHVQVCMYACVHVHMCMCACVCTCVYVCVHESVQMCVCACIACVHVYMRVCMRECVSIPLVCVPGEAQGARTLTAPASWPACSLGPLCSDSCVRAGATFSTCLSHDCVHMARVSPGEGQNV